MSSLPSLPSDSKAKKTIPLTDDLRQKLLSRVQHHQRERSHRRVARFTKWANDPVGFVENVLFRSLT